MKFEQIKEYLAESDFYNIEETDSFVAVNDINLKFHLRNENFIPEDSPERLISALKSVFSNDMHSFKISTFDTDFTYKGELFQKIKLYKISGIESYTQDKVIDIYFPVQNKKPIYTKIPEDDLFRRVIIRILNSRQALEILSDSFAPSIF